MKGKEIANTILIIEDDSGLIVLLSEIAENCGYQTACVLSGGSALDWLKENTPFLILLDYSLPDMNGKDFIKELKTEGMNIPPFIVSTGQGDERIAVEMMKLGARDYIIKDNQFLDMMPIVIGKVAGEIGNEIKLSQAIEALRESEEKYRLIAENTSDGILILGADGHVKYVSPAYPKQTGYTEIEETSRNSASIYSIIHFDDRETLFTEISEAIKQKKSELTYSYRVQHKAGHYIWREDSAKFKYDTSGIYCGSYVICRDITGRKQTEEQLKLLSRAIEQSPVSVVITDKSGDIEYVNPKFTEVTGYTLKEVKGNNPRILQSGRQTNEFYKELWDTILAGKEWNGEFQNKKKTGESYWESAVISSILDKEGRISYFIAVKEDITEKKKMVADLIKAKERAEESDNLKTAFLNNISHEIRTPFNGILGFLPLLQSNDLTSFDRDEFMSMINKSAYRLMNTINDIVEISQIQTGQIMPTKSEINLQNMPDELFYHFKTDAERKGLKFTVRNHLPDNLERISTDNRKLNSILSILIGNAIKFTKTGFIELSIELVDKACRDDACIVSAIQFSVKDTGIGIPHDKHLAIFDLFMQVDGSSTRQFEGSGLGLAIASAYVKMLGGEIWVKSNEEGKAGETGSTFYFTIPCNCESDEKTIIQNAVAENQVDKEVIKLKILIAEDDRDSAKLLSFTVKPFCYEVLFAETGVEAVEACRNITDIDLVLMDIKMPEIDGYEATRQIRKFNANIVIIAQTAFALPGDREKATSAGCNDYVSKPYNQAILISLIKKYF